MAIIFKTVTHHSKKLAPLCQIHFYLGIFHGIRFRHSSPQFCRPGSHGRKREAYSLLSLLYFHKTIFIKQFSDDKISYPKQTMKTQITMLLTTLAIFDILFLFCTFPLFSLQAMMHFKNFLNMCVYKGEKKSNNFKRCISEWVLVNSN